MKIVDYRKLRPSNINTEEFRHLWLLLFWPLFGIFFILLERGGLQEGFTYVHCALDDSIPFCEYFVIPYMFWFVYIVGILIYSLLFDLPCFKRFMYFVMLTYSITLVIYVLFPTAQALRPQSFARDNLFTRFLAGFYAFDTNTNVCPSIHVLGAMGVTFAAWHSRLFGSWPWRIAFSLADILICASTVFLKQHSVLDIFWALPLCLLGYALVWGGGKRAVEGEAGLSQ